MFHHKSGVSPDTIDGCHFFLTSWELRGGNYHLVCACDAYLPFWSFSSHIFTETKSPMLRSSKAGFPPHFHLRQERYVKKLGAGGWLEGTPGCSTARHNILRLQAQAPPRNPVVAAFKNAAVWIRHSSWDIEKMRSFLSAVCSGNGVFLPTNMIDLIIPLALKILA